MEPCQGYTCCVLLSITEFWWTLFNLFKVQLGFQYRIVGRVDTAKFVEEMLVFLSFIRIFVSFIKLSASLYLLQKLVLFMVYGIEIGYLQYN